MKLMLEPETKQDAIAHIYGPELLASIADLSNEIRNDIKHNAKLSEETIEYLSKIREVLSGLLIDYRYYD